MLVISDCTKGPWPTDDEARITGSNGHGRVGNIPVKLTSAAAVAIVVGLVRSNIGAASGPV